MPSGIGRYKLGPNGKQLRGLAAASPETRRRVASQGGKTEGAGLHRWDYWDARFANQKSSRARPGANSPRIKGRFCPVDPSKTSR